MDRELPKWSMSALASSRPSTSTTYQTTSSSRDSATSGSVASNLTSPMVARTVSELANWDGRLDQQRQSSKWRRSSSSVARDSYHTPLENQPIEIFQPPSRFSDQKRTEKAASRSNPERDLLVDSSENARLLSHVDTSSTPSHDVHHYHQPPILHIVPNTTLPPSPFITASVSSYFTPNSSVLPSRVHNSRPSSPREHTELLKLASTTESEVIDLTIEDTDEELSVSEMLVPNSMVFNNRRAKPGPSRRPPSSGASSPSPLEQSLFTPPRRPKKRSRLFMDYLAVPAFPKGLTKANYQPMSGHSVVPLSGPAVPSTLKESSFAEPSVTKECTPSRQEWKGKEREHDMVTSRKYERRAHASGADVATTASLDAFYGHTIIPLVDGDTYPPLTTLDLATNTRFQFAHTWRGHTSRLWEAELDCMSKFRLLGKASIWVRSVDTSSPRIPGTAGCVSSEQLRSWELVPPGSEPQGKDVLDEQADATESHLVAGVDVNDLSLPDEPVPGIAVNPTLSLPQSVSLTAVDLEHDMNQYFNGLSDSPNKHTPGQQPAPTHTFGPAPFQSGGHAQMSPLELGFPSLESDPRLADTVGHECFLGVPPSPTTSDIQPLTAPGLTPDSPFDLVDDFTASPSNMFTAEASLMHAWSFDQGEGFLPDNNSHSDNHVQPTALGTIDPSLLGPEKPQPPRASKDATLKRRSKLPEPVIYIRRPIDSSALPLVSGKRPVQIKYRDPEGSPAIPSTQSAPQQVSSNSVEHPVANDFAQAKRFSAPSRKLRESHIASESDSDFIPETSKFEPKPKTRVKRSGVKGKESLAEDQGADAGTVPAASFCHQCRYRSNRPKMLCSNTTGGRTCGKWFCNRCILYRYPDVTFDQHSTGFMCPVCTNTCNCSCCSRNRGEEFVSMRLGGLAASIFKTKVTLVRDVDKPPQRVSPSRNDGNARRSASGATTPTPEPSALPMPSQFWAHVYGLEGDRMGSAFMTRGLSLSKPPPPKKDKTTKPRRREKKRATEPRGPRVFVGLPRASWKIRAVRDVEPSVDVDVDVDVVPIRDKGKDKDKDKARSTPDEGRVVCAAGAGAAPRCRWYVGRRAPLHEPYGRMPGTASPTMMPVSDSDGSLSSLSELEVEGEGEGEGAYWPQPEVGECCSWAPPPPPPGTSLGLSSAPGIPISRTGTEVDGLQSLDLASGLGLASDGDGDADVEVEVEVDMGVDANGDERGSASTALSEEDMARAISAALAALGVPQPP